MITQDSRKGFRRIYIRHADKEYANGDASLYKHDPGITSSGVEKAKMVARHLVEQWGVPDKIIVSPYRRTRETAKVMRSTLIKPGVLRKIPIHIDRELSEYLGNHREVPIDVTESTLIHEPPHPETFAEMKIRVKSHHDKITKYIKKSGGVIWIISHGLIMKQVGILSGIKMPREFPNLTCLSISDTDPARGEIITFHEASDVIHDSEENEETEFDSDEIVSSYYRSERSYPERSNSEKGYVPRYEIVRNDNAINRWDSFKNDKTKGKESEEIIS